MLGSKLGDGIAVVRDYSDGVPAIQAYPGELNQVWTSLIDNALDAMNGAGTLRLATRVEEDNVVVEVGDTGPGMPPQVASRAFDAFYTTKDTGKGPGLGLDIARRTVVERHGGLITIDSQPGNTVLRVRLPIRLAARVARETRPRRSPGSRRSRHQRHCAPEMSTAGSAAPVTARRRPVRSPWRPGGHPRLTSRPGNSRARRPPPVRHHLAPRHHPAVPCRPRRERAPCRPRRERPPRRDRARRWLR